LKDTVEVKIYLTTLMWPFKVEIHYTVHLVVHPGELTTGSPLGYSGALIWAFAYILEEKSHHE
jgi:hypothetical protein